MRIFDGDPLESSHVVEIAGRFDSLFIVIAFSKSFHRGCVISDTPYSCILKITQWLLLM